MRLLLVFIVLIILGVPCAAQYNARDIHDRILGIMRQYDAVGLSVVVVKDKKILFSDTFGYNPNYNNVEKRDPIKNNGIYYIASISKTFVGTAIMQLVEKGLISLDSDVNKYLNFRVENPYYPQVPITVRMLLSHHSSIKKGAPYNSFDKIASKNIDDVKQCFNNSKPGTDYSYSNLGYAILGAVIENVSGLRFDDYIERHIISPMGLYGSYNVSKIDSNLFVKSYRYNKSKGRYIKQYDTYSQNLPSVGYVKGYSTPSLRPAGGVMISARDLAKYMMMHMNNGLAANGRRIISENSEMLLRDKTIHNLYYTKAYIPNVRLVGMNGGARGMHTEMFFSPDKDYGFVILCNGCNSTGSSDSGLNKLVMRELYNTFILKGDTKK